MLEIHNSFNVFIQTVNVNDVSQVRVNSRNLGFTQTWENNTKSPCAKEKCDSLVLSRSDLWMVWRCHGIPRVYCYYFYLEPTVRKDTWMRTASVTVMVTFSKVAFWKLLDHSYVQIVPSQQLQGTLTTAFWKIPYSSIFYGHGSTCVLNLSSRLQ